MKKIERIRRLILATFIQLLVFGFLVAPAANGQEPTGPRTAAVHRWVEGELARYGQRLPEGIDFSAPSATAVANALRLVDASPLTGSGTQQPPSVAGGSPAPSGGGSSQSPPPIEIQLPPHPPESQAPPAQWRPPIEVPDPSTIPSPPLSQAPPQQQRPPVQLPNPSGGTAARPPIEPLTIPLPPHPPEAQAPWNQRG